MFPFGVGEEVTEGTIAVGNLGMLLASRALIRQGDGG